MKKYILVSLLLAPTSCRSNDSKKPVESLPTETPTVETDPIITPGATNGGDSKVEYEIKQSSKELPVDKIYEFARVSFIEKDLAPRFTVRNLLGDCNFTVYFDNKSVFVLSVLSHSVQKCLGEFTFSVESRNWSEKIHFEITFIDSNPEIKVEFTFKDPATGNEIKAFNKGETLYLKKNDVELVGKMKYGANANIQVLKDGDPSLKKNCAEWSKLGADSSAAKKFFGMNSGATLVRFNAGEELSKDLTELAKSEAAKKGLNVKDVLLAPSIAFKKFTYLPKSLTQKGLTAGARASSESFSKPLNDFLNTPGRLVDELALATVCDLINGHGIRALDNDGTDGPTVRLIVEEAQ